MRPPEPPTMRPTEPTHSPRRTRRRAAPKDARRAGPVALAVALVAIALLGATGAWSSSLRTLPHLGDGARAPALLAESDPGAVGTPKVPAASSSSPVYGWEEQNASNAPEPLGAASMAYDAADGYMVLFGGYTGPASGPTPSTDTWILQNGSWTNITATAGSPPEITAFHGSYGSPIAYDAKDGYVVVANDSGTPGAWEFHAGHWSAIAAPPSGYVASLEYDSTDGYLVATTQGQFHSCLVYSIPASTYTYSNGSWANLTNASTPCLDGPVIADDPGVHGLLAFGGYGQYAGAGGGTTMSNRTWSFAGGVWTNLSSTANAGSLWSQKYQGTLAYDPTVGAAVLQTSNATGVGTFWFQGHWTNQTNAFEPDPLASAAMAWNPAKGQIQMTGGFAPGGAGPTNATWAYSSNLSLSVRAPQASPTVADVGAPVAFSPEALGGTAPLNYSWNFGDGATSFLANPSHAYATNGSFLATVTVTDALAVHASASVAVSVDLALQGGAARTTVVADVGVPATFSPVVSDGVGPVTYAWAFGDGSSSSAEAATHAYSAPGTFHGGFWANDSGGGAVHSGLTIVVSPALSVSFVASPSSPSLGQLVNFSATVTGGSPPYTYSWAFGDGGTGGDLANISHVFTTNGPFSATVRVSDAAGGTAVSARNLTVALNLSIFGSWSFGAAPLPLQFTSHVQGGVPGYSFQWAFGDGATSSAVAPSHTYSTPGYHTATLTVTDAIGSTAEATWPLFVASGSGSLSVQLVGDPAHVAPGGSTVLTAVVSGGVGGYAIRWNTGTLACAPAGILSESCTLPDPGTFAVSVRVVDSVGSSASSSVPLLAGHVGGTETPPAGVSLGPWAPVVGALLGAAATLAAILLLRSRGGGPELGSPVPPNGRSASRSGSGRGPRDRSPSTEGPTGTEDDRLADLV